MERANTRQSTVPSIPRSNANTVVDHDTKKETCWNLEGNKSKRPEWWVDTAAASANDGETIL